MKQLGSSPASQVIQRAAQGVLDTRFLAFLADILADYQEHGPQAIDRMRKEDPTAYIRMIASLVPKQIDKAPNPLEHFTNKELEQLETYLESIANNGESGASGGDRPTPH
jgi:hypothetical protein